MQLNRYVLLTGGAGFIGSHVVDELIKKGKRVVVVDNLTTGKKDQINPRATFIEGDVRDNNFILNLFNKYKFKTVLHLAGQPSIVNSFSNPVDDINTNFLGTVNITMACIKYKANRFVYASSMTVYGHPLKLPIKEDALCIPVNYYGISKYAAERFVHVTATSTTTPLAVTSLRMFNVYGPRQSITNPYQGVLAIFLGNVLRNEAITIFGDGKQTRDFVYIDDVVNLWVKSLTHKNSYGGVFNLGYGKKTSIISLAKTVILACGKNPSTYPIKFTHGRPGDQRIIWADISLAQKMLSYKPRVDLLSGLKQTIEWAKNNQAL